MKPRGRAKGLLTFGLVIAATWTAWEIVKAPLAVRLPPELAIRLAPASPEVLRRAAESELIAKRPENAVALAEDSLARAPFNARALRVFGLASAQTARPVDVDSIVTLAGNWSLRDDPAHAWLVERRLRQGNYGSAFAHADTLARRRVDNPELTYNLFAEAAIQDDRSLIPLASLLAKDPPWRSNFLNYLLKRPDASVVIIKLGIILDRMNKPFSVMELRLIYETLFSTGRLNEMVAFRRNTNAPPASEGIRNGDFSETGDDRILPLDWSYSTSSNATADVIADDLRPDSQALRVDFSGGETALLAEQILMLSSGEFRFSGEYRIERGTPGSVRWSVTCVENGTLVGTFAPSGGEGNGWRRFTEPLAIPASGCAVQRLRLEAVGGEPGAGATQWFDALRIHDRPKDR